jgi:hypothetical protein
MKSGCTLSRNYEATHDRWEVVRRILLVEDSIPVYILEERVSFDLLSVIRT